MVSTGLCCDSAVKCKGVSESEWEVRMSRSYLENVFISNLCGILGNNEMATAARIIM